MSGCHAGLTSSGGIEVVKADGTRTPVGPWEGEPDGRLEFVPDGAGGLWWLETVVPVPGRPLARQLVHAAADGTRDQAGAGAGRR